jgi:phosphatidylinositol 4-phosphatase
MVNLIDKKGS